MARLRMHRCENGKCPHLATGLWELKAGKLTELMFLCAECGLYKKLLSAKPGERRLELIKSFSVETPVIEKPTPTYWMGAF